MNVQRNSAIPIDLTTFVDRRAEATEIRRLLTVSRLVTLTGAGGVGKTRLALHVAGRLTRAFPDGAYVAELANVRDANLLAQSVASALGLQNQSVPEPLDVVAGHLSQRQVLLVLDNCEHLVDDCAQMVDLLLRAAPGLRVLATSRQVIGITGERAFPVPPLDAPMPDVRLTPKQLAGYPAVSLFAQRAAVVLPGFALTEDNADTVQRLVHRLDGLPLAIELAAAMMRTLSARQILDRLDNRFALLTEGSRAALPRQRTLRAAMDWSHTLCSDGERELWARISVFSGGFDLEAVQAVCSSEDLPSDAMIALLHGLIEKSLVMRRETDKAECPRYLVLETVREYGYEKLTRSGILATLRRRHRDYYLHLATEAQRHWFGPQQADWLARLRVDHANVRAALDYCLTTPGDAEAGMRLVVTPRHWFTLGAVGEGRYWLGRLLAAESRDSPERTNALGTHAVLCLMQGAVEEGLVTLAEYRRTAEQQGDLSALAWAQHHQALISVFRGDRPQAAALFEDAVTRHLDLGDLERATTAMVKLAIVLCLLGQHDRALAVCRECSAITTAHAETWITAEARYAEAVILWRRGDLDAAEELARQSLRLRQPLNDLPGTGLDVELLAWSAAAGRRYERAACLLGILTSLWEKAGGALLPIPFFVESHQRCEQDVRDALSPKAFAEASRRGAALSYEEAIAYALDEQRPREPRSGRGAHSGAPLTRREQEVADLVAEGMSNKDIAAKLVIAPRTAENHVARILRKLGFTSRSQVAVWAYERGAGKRHQ